MSAASHFTLEPVQRLDFCVVWSQEVVRQRNSGEVCNGVAGAVWICDLTGVKERSAFVFLRVTRGCAHELRMRQRVHLTHGHIIMAPVCDKVFAAHSYSCRGTRHDGSWLTNGG